MKFFQTTIYKVLPGGSVDGVESFIVETDINDAVKGAEQVATDAAIRMQRQGWEIFWDFEETSFRASDSTTMRAARYLTVKAL